MAKNYLIPKFKLKLFSDQRFKLKLILKVTPHLHAFKSRLTKDTLLLGRTRSNNFSRYFTHTTHAP